MMVSIRLEGTLTLPPLTVADTVTVLSCASTLLSAAAMVTAPVPEVWPAGDGEGSAGRDGEVAAYGGR